MAKRDSIDKRRMTEHETSTNISYIEQYLGSLIRKNLLIAIVSFKPDMTLQRQDYNNYRACLVSKIVFCSAQRVGVVHGSR